MKRLIAVFMVLAVAGLAFSQDIAAPATEDEAMQLLLQQSTQLRLTAQDTTTAAEAFKAMINAGIEIQNAYRMVSSALNEGLRTSEMKKLADQVMLRSKQGSSSAECEIAARTMLQEQLRTRTGMLTATATATQTQAQTQTQTQTQTRTQTRTEAPAEAGTPATEGPQSGTGSGSGSGSQTGKGK